MDPHPVGFGVGIGMGIEIGIEIGRGIGYGIGFGIGLPHSLLVKHLCRHRTAAHLVAARLVLQMEGSRSILVDVFALEGVEELLDRFRLVRQSWRVE